jgi:hypothetical protein
MERSKPRLGRAPLVPERVRRIGGRGFAFIPNRFLLEGFFAALEQDELLLYMLLVLAGNRDGISFYHYDTICSLLRIPIDRYLEARRGLLEKDLIAFDGTRFQVLELPERPPAAASRLLRTKEDFELHDPATVHGLFEKALGKGASEGNEQTRGEDENDER